LPDMLVGMGGAGQSCFVMACILQEKLTGFL
jgi:hypothetical protein